MIDVAKLDNLSQNKGQSIEGLQMSHRDVAINERSCVQISLCKDGGPIEPVHRPLRRGLPLRSLNLEPIGLQLALGWRGVVDGNL